MTLDQIYFKKCSEPSDINEHLPILRHYAGLCQYVTEFGVRGVVSTWALMAARPLTLHSYDISSPGGEATALLERLAKAEFTQFAFVQADTRTVTIAPTDLLFIDTFHTYSHLKCELYRHASKVSKYIIMHDTVTFGEQGEVPSEPGLNLAIQEFLDAHHEWKVLACYFNNNGLTILRRT